MRFARSFVTLLALIAAAPLAAQAGGRGGAAQPAAGGGGRGGPPAPPFMIQTRAWVDGGTIPLRYSQATTEEVGKGNGVSPQLSWINPPAGTVSFVLNMHDMEGARNKTLEDQAHWVV